ncbi:hypothetical protein [Methylobacterium fujisawaense]
MRPLYFEQDGGYFFVRLRPFYTIDFDATPELPSCVCPSDVWIAPCRVRDFNEADCAEAIRLFELECAANGFVPVRAPRFSEQPIYQDHPAVEHAAIRAALIEDGLPLTRAEAEALYAEAYAA